MNIYTNETLSKQAETIAVISADLDGRITVFNKNAELLLGYHADEVIGAHTPLLFHEPQELQLLQAQLSAECDKPLSGFAIYRELLNSANTYQNWTYVNKDGSSMAVQTQVSPINNQHQQLIGLLLLITRQKNIHIVPLSELPDQSIFTTVLNREFKRMQRSQSPISIIKIDMDHYKNYLKTQGEQATHLCMEQIAIILQQRIQRAGDLLSYHSHDEFAVILPDTDQPSAVKVAEVLRLLVAAQQIPHPSSDVAEYVTISTGVATMTPAKEASVDEIMEKVDNGLHQAKLEGRNCSRIGE